MRNILVIRFSSLGDIILTLPAIEALRASWPDARIGMTVKEQYASLFSGNPAVDRLMPLAPREEHRGFGGLRRYADEVRREPWDVIVDLHGSLRSRLLARFVGGGRVLRVNLQHLRRQALVRFKKPLLGYPAHIVERYMAALDSHGDSATDRRPRLTPSDKGQSEAGALLESWGLGAGEAWVAMAPGAGRKSKQWGAERFSELARMLAEEDRRPVVVLGSGEETGLVKQVAGRAGSRRVFSHPGSDLMVHAALLARASGLVTNDSGLMHLAVAVGTAVVAVFGSTTSSLGFYPLGDHDQVLSVPLDCRPCSLHGLDRCPRGDLACLEGISASRVRDAVRAMEGRWDEGSTG